MVYSYTSFAHSCNYPVKKTCSSNSSTINKIMQIQSKYFSKRSYLTYANTMLFDPRLNGLRFQKYLFFRDFHAQQSLEFHRMVREKHPLSAPTVGRDVLLIKEVRGQ